MTEGTRLARRMAAVPQILEEESFGSWLARLAAAHFTNRVELSRALLLENGENGIDVRDIDYSSQPAPGLIEALSKRAACARSDLELMLVPAVLAILPRGSKETEPYCPSCWQEDSARGVHYIRKQWCEKWTALCETHQVPLRTPRLSVERLLCGAHNPAWMGEFYASMWSVPLRADLARAQGIIRANALGRCLAQETKDRARVLVDLALLLGTAFDSGSLIDQSMDLEDEATRKLSWARPQATGGARVCEPRGTLEVRQLALRLSVVILNRLEGAGVSTRAEDISLMATLNLLQPESQLASACEQMLLSWPHAYRAAWELAFGRPGQGGSGYFARRYRQQSLSPG